MLKFKKSRDHLTNHNLYQLTVNQSQRDKKDAVNISEKSQLFFVSKIRLQADLLARTMMLMMKNKVNYV